MNIPSEPLNRREFLERAARAAAATAAFTGLGSAAAGTPGARLRPRISYFCNGEIHVSEVGRPEGRPLTTGHMDFKPSWSKTENRLVCFRRTKDDPITVNWKSAIFVINTDGTEFQQLTAGTRTDFNPTWTRDGRNTPIWNRKNDQTGGFFVMHSQVDAKPGQEVPLSDASYHTWAHSCLADGRILVNSYHPAQGWGVFLMTPRPDGKSRYERVECELATKGQLHRASVSPSERKICFEYLAGAKFTEPGHTIYLGDFDAQGRAITNLKPIANADARPVWFAYPRWIDGETAVVYHS